MTSEMTIEREGDDIVFSGRFTKLDFMRLHLDPVDRRLFEPSEKVEDWLLTLEMLFRRAREQGL